MVSSSYMKRKGLFLVAVSLTIFVIGLVLQPFHAVVFLTRNSKVTIEVNGSPVNGEMLEGQLAAIVTTRVPGKAHSYRIFFEGDTDFNGDTGFVIDCHTWVAPDFPLLLEAADYPPCNILSEDVYKDRRWPVFRRQHSLEFAASGGATIRIRERHK